MENYKTKNLKVLIPEDERIAYVVFGCLCTSILGMLTYTCASATVEGIKGSYEKKDVTFTEID